MKYRRILIKIVNVVCIVLGTVFFAVSCFIKNVFGGAKIEQILYSIMYADGTSISPFIDGIKYCLPIIVVLSLILMLPYTYYKYNETINLKVSLLKWKKNFCVRLFPIRGYSLIVFLALLAYSLNSVGFFQYYYNQKHESEIFDKFYVNPGNVTLTFPKKKKNLIYIYLESMEASFSQFNVDGQKVNAIPNLTQIALENTSFSNTLEIGGAKSIYGTTWTVAAMVAQSAGIPLKLVVDGNSYGEYDAFLPGVISLGDILEKNGYKQYIMMGSTASFAGRDEYFKEHGNYEVYDYVWAKETGKIDDDYYVWWGFEDSKLFTFAKEKLQEISKQEEPFNFTLLTVDTHAGDGYLDNTCSSDYDDPYMNVLKCNDSMVAEFVSWILKQSFVKDTSVVIVGDHLTMRLEVANYLTDNRTIYNVFINSATKTDNIYNREFTSFDIFPTTLASLGVEIEGDRLGLGTNLFSNIPTYAEDLGLEYMNSQIEKYSSYYNKNFLGKEYLEMLKSVDEN